MGSKIRKQQERQSDLGDLNIGQYHGMLVRTLQTSKENSMEEKNIKQVELVGNMFPDGTSI